MNMRDLVPRNRSDREPAAMTGGESAHPIMTLHREMNRMFDDVLRGFGSPFGSSMGGLSQMSGPSLDIDETDAEYRVTAELPGLGKDDVEVTCEDGVLSIRGEKQGEKREGRAFSERWFGRFERRVSVPDADEGRAQASFRDGLLTITLPKTERARQKVRRIPINDSPATTH